MSPVLRAALVAELTKFRHARVVATATALLVLGTALLPATMLLAARRDDAATTAKLGTLVDPGGWVGYLAAGGQITAVAGLLGFGVVLSWTMGREFAEGTVSSLFAVPVPRSTTAASKLLVYLAWVLVVSLALTLALVVLGFVFGLGRFDPDAAPLVLRQSAVTVLTGLLAVPAGWVATLGRGLLPGIAATILLIVAAQVAVMAGTDGWFPFAAVGVWASATSGSAPGATELLQLGLVVPLAVGFAVLTTEAWRRLELDR